MTHKLLTRATYTQFGRYVARKFAVGALIAFIFYVCMVCPFLPQDGALWYWTETTFEMAGCLAAAAILSLLALALIYGPRTAVKPQANG